jgi:hypothetical protein
MSSGIKNFLIVLISASFVIFALLKISLPKKSSDIIISILLSLVWIPFACEPNTIIFDMFNPLSISHFSKNLIAFIIFSLAIGISPFLERISLSSPLKSFYI